MKIQSNRQLKELQKDFKTIFPFLKIEFFKIPHGIGQESEENEMLDTNLKVEDVQDVEKTGVFTFDENMTVGEFETKVQSDFGLNIQVYRKEYGKWLQTWATDDWTLKDQNIRSKVMADKGKLL